MSGWRYKDRGTHVDAKHVTKKADERDGDAELPSALQAIKKVKIIYLPNVMEDNYPDEEDRIGKCPIDISMTEVLEYLGRMMTRKVTRDSSLMDFTAAVPCIQLKLTRVENFYDEDDDGIFLVTFPTPNTSKYDMEVQEMSEQELKENPFNGYVQL